MWSSLAVLHPLETQAKLIPFLTAHYPSPLPLIKLL